ncbi:hypothetical protein EXN66_Car003123 [Channa argus]|uniref:Uncharacterized protein n=1 Tax=Channa argus TaxID=215402 RepID=A0A6G1PAX6_CHAAH|nr:hypothetical protein EXN66_Car003123 [Channa argus]
MALCPKGQEEDWRPIQGVPSLPPMTAKICSRHPSTLNKTSGYGYWMDRWTF